MTESEWLASEDPTAMLDYLKWWRSHAKPANGTGYARTKKPSLLPSDRKLRLFCYAWRELAGMPNAFRDENADPPTVMEVHDGALGWACSLASLSGVAKSVAAAFLREIVGNPWRPAVLPKARILVPVGPFEIDAGTIDRGWGDEYCPWLTPEVLSLAEAAYEERSLQPIWGHEDYQGGAGGLETRKREVIVGHVSDGLLDPFRLMLVAEALEDAGCDDTILLEHLRSPRPHVRGCWALDLILGA